MLPLKQTSTSALGVRPRRFVVAREIQAGDKEKLKTETLKR
jgi:hypothetical protein